RRAWVAELYRQYGADPGIFAPLFLNLVYLEPGEALFQSAGVLHAYLRGTGVELMAESDNVVRAGLTEKYVDVDLLNRVVTFRAQSPERVEPRPADGAAEIVKPCDSGPLLLVYDTPTEDFRLYRVDFDRAREADASEPSTGSRTPARGVAFETSRHPEGRGPDRSVGEFHCGPAPCILACASGEVSVGEVPVGSEATPRPVTLAPGHSAFIPARVSRFRVSGTGIAFIATSGIVDGGQSTASTSSAQRAPGPGRQ
ncbi:MAG: hypothetical protein ACLFM0_10400, partial [Spirochaetales bacterium]